MKKIITGIVERGDGISLRDYGIPTANLDLKGIDPGISFGVYAARVKSPFGTYLGALCYGVGEPPKFEVHLLGFEGNLLGRELSVEVVEKVSELIAWTSRERMRQKIVHDIQLVLDFMKAREVTPV